MECSTGSGKSIAALNMFSIANEKMGGDLTLFVVVPTKVLQNQWYDDLTAMGMNAGRCGGGYKSKFGDHEALVWTMDTMAKRYTEFTSGFSSLSDFIYLIADEVHRVGSPTRKAMVKARWHSVLGLSATFSRQDVDMQELIGPLFYSYTFDDGLEDDIIRPAHLWNRLYQSSPPTQETYDDLTRDLADIKKRLLSIGKTIHPGNISTLMQSGDYRVRSMAKEYQMATLDRKRALYADPVRLDICQQIIAENLPRGLQILVLSESVEAVKTLASRFEGLGVFHFSEMKAREQRESMRTFREGDAQIIWSARQLIEGIDIPTIDVVVIHSSNSSERQIIQSIGRSVRKREGGKLEADVYRLTAVDTVDETVIRKLRQSKVLPGRLIHDVGVVE